MTNAHAGHSALDATTALVEQLAAQPDNEARVVFLEAAVAHAESQLTIAEDQYDRVTAKWENIKEQWEAKVDEAHTIRVNASNQLDAFNRELEALVS